ncbi:hypothetical protein G7Y89_g13750 [Cudoniella acicularis]|uniref:EXPERA domain-containing protein n=1 Tax=Cudoniella acicularis TaxID=354080 RepID=A0A8H4R8P6_9HELO|nr:hypothetical protein G7Y89_g13750 [Cudoniella acicularis]
MEASQKILNNSAHMFYPPELEIANYLANELHGHFLLFAFAVICAIILLKTFIITNRAHPKLPGKEKAAILWFTLSGAIHLFFEGYFSLNHFRMGPAQDLFGQLWKEDALADSRYLTSDPFVLCMETVTAFLWGPICLTVAVFITTSHPLRHPLQIIVCVGQIYGLILYYATSMFDHYYNGIAYSRPEFLYFWFYYFFMNFIWMVFPGILLVSSVRTVTKALAALEKINTYFLAGRKIRRGSFSAEEQQPKPVNTPRPSANAHSNENGHASRSMQEQEQQPMTTSYQYAYSHDNIQRSDFAQEQGLNSVNTSQPRRPHVNAQSHGSIPANGSPSGQEPKFVNFSRPLVYAQSPGSVRATGSSSRGQELNLMTPRENAVSRVMKKQPRREPHPFPRAISSIRLEGYADPYENTLLPTDLDRRQLHFRELHPPPYLEREELRPMQHVRKEMSAI